MTATQACALVLIAMAIGAGCWEWLFCTEYRRQARKREAQIARLQKRIARLEHGKTFTATEARR